jgi:outer membrane biosynthesis protein TonB
MIAAVVLALSAIAAPHKAAKETTTPCPTSTPTPKPAAKGTPTPCPTSTPTPKPAAKGTPTPCPTSTPTPKPAAKGTPTPTPSGYDAAPAPKETAAYGDVYASSASTYSLAALAAIVLAL